MSLSPKEPWEFEQYSWMNKFIDNLNLPPLKSGTDEVTKTKLKKFLYDNDLTNSEVLKCYELKDDSCFTAGVQIVFNKAVQLLSNDKSSIHGTFFVHFNCLNLFVLIYSVFL